MKISGIKTRIAGIIVRNGKLLLLKAKGYNDFWTPGGKIEKGESDEECLRRELKEELNAELQECKFVIGCKCVYKSQYGDHKTISRFYLASIKGRPKPANEIEKFFWLSKADLEKNKKLILPADKKVLTKLGFLKKKVPV